MTDPNLFYFTDDQRGADPVKMAEKLPTNTGIIFRHYQTEYRASLAHELSILCKKRKLKLIIAQNPALSKKIRAFGCHLPEYMVQRLPLLKHQYPDLYFSVACHSIRQVLQAQKYGANGAFLSPLFPTKSHPGSRVFSPYSLCSARQKLTMPVYGLGGVTNQKGQFLKGLGYSGYGAISELENRYL
ncbi:thiamine phosphate synthase [Sneathiella sp.]|jgi:thiamine-phosphate pyrophosphorylase|uniref:thiamine phosphate synthase n=1 Tax=Sneathiella sp. TaxID=1964365 RepID=UPI0039E32073